MTPEMLAVEGWNTEAVFFFAKGARPVVSTL